MTVWALVEQGLGLGEGRGKGKGCELCAGNEQQGACQAGFK